MIFYYLMLSCICIVFLAINEYRYITNNNDLYLEKRLVNVALGLSWVLLSAIQGLRAYSIGTDTHGYVNGFINLDTANYELGFQLLNKFVHCFTSDGTIYLLIVAMITNGLIISSIGKMSEKPFVSVFCYVTLYYYFNSFNAMRQYIAVALLLHAYYYAEQKKWLKYGVIIVIGVFFHSSAIAGVAFYFLVDEKKSFNSKVEVEGVLKYIIRIFLPIILIVVCYVLFDKMISILVSINPKYEIYLLEDFAEKGGIQQPIVYSFIFLIYIFLGNNRRWLYVMAVAVCIAFLQLKIQMISRFLWYFDIFSIFVLADIWDTKYFEPKNLVRVGIVVMGLCFMSYYLSVNYMRLSHYNFAFFQ